MKLNQTYNKDIFLKKKDLDFLLKWINSNKSKFVNNTVSLHRKFLTLNQKLNHPSLFFDVKKKILDKENIVKNYIDDSTYGDYIGYITNGGKIHNHIDPTISGYDHIRFNLFLSVPTKGGFPIYNGVTIPVKVGDYVRCNSSKEYHECEMVEGDIPRIVISYGIYLKRKIYQYK
jgi:hypothetical protein